MMLIFLVNYMVNYLAMPFDLTGKKVLVTGAGEGLAGNWQEQS